MHNKPWFKRKRFGLGWVPTSWQGWLATAVYLFFIIRAFLRIDKNSHSVSDTLINFSIPFIFLSIIFIIICRLKEQKTGR
jgi:hypothetical protein